MPRSMIRFALQQFTTFLIIGVFSLCLRAQFQPDESAALDSLGAEDSLAATALDSAALADSSKERGMEVDTTIIYSANSIEFFVDERVTLLRGNATVKYQSMSLSAALIRLDWTESTITAEGVVDTLWADSLETVLDTVLVTGLPVFIEGDKSIQGEQMVYNLKTRRGRITEGVTDYQDGYYWGAALKKDSTEVLYAGPGSFTACSEEKPHYTFRAQQMKLIPGDKVVAKPVVLYIGEVPIAAVPFGVFPSQKGRQSGLIIPTYGESAVQGRFIRHLGYYWAPNDYYDLTGFLDYYERSGFLFNTRNRYNWRYHLSGSVEGSFINQHLGTQRSRRWELKLNHDQQIDPDTRLLVSANMVSDGSYYQDYSFNLNEQLSQTLRSDATLSHTFPGSKHSFSANVHHEQNLLNEEITQSIPRLTYRIGQGPIIPMPEKAADDTSASEPHWYNQIYYSYTGEALHSRVLDQTISIGDTALVQHRRSAAKHTLTFNSPQNALKYLSLTPALTYNEQWFDEYKDYSSNPNGVLVSGFRTRRTFSNSLGFSSKLYGFWLNPLPGVQTFRHTLTPTFSLSFQPDFRDPAWGYYKEVTDSLGVTTRKDRFSGSLYGSTAAGRTFALNVQLANIFQMKYGLGENEKKMDLFTLNFSSSYNFAADSLRFAPLSSSFRASPISGAKSLGPIKTLSLDLSTYHSFYKFGVTNEYDELYFDPKKGKLLRLRSFDISTTASLSLGALVHSPEKTRYDEDRDLAVEATAEPDTVLELPAPSLPEEWFLGQVPWDLQLSWHYTSNRYNPHNPSETFWLNASVDASLTQNWQISYNTRIDLVEHKVVSAGFTIYRDMHCWEARLIWNPLGIGQGYFFKINLKASDLQDVKVERRHGQGTFMGF
ncbi:MAG: LPS assembly protein LptD [bacterium]